MDLFSAYHLRQAFVQKKGLHTFGCVQALLPYIVKMLRISAKPSQQRQQPPMHRIPDTGLCDAAVDVIEPTKVLLDE